MRKRWAVLRERIQNTPGLRGDVVALVLCAAVGLSTGGFLLAQQDWNVPGRDRYRFSAVFELAPGVHPESVQEVRIAGVKVGRIVSASPTDDGFAEVTMEIDPDQTVYENARAMLRAKSPVNVMYVALLPGGPPAKPMPDGGTIPVENTGRPVQPYELLDNIDGRAQAALTALISQADIALADGPRRLGPGLNATSDAFAAFEPVVTSLQGRRDKIARLVTALSDIARAVGKNDTRLTELVVSMQQTLQVVAEEDPRLREVLQQLPGFSAELRDAVEGVDGLTTQLNPTLSNLEDASERLPDALEGLNDTLHAARGTVRNARPLVRHARPVIADLRPFVLQTRGSLQDLRPVTRNLPQATTQIVPWMEDLAAFVYQTSSAFSLHDVNGGFGRLNAVFDVTNPLGGLADQGGNDG